MSQQATKRVRKVPQILISEDHGLYSEFANSSPHPVRCLVPRWLHSPAHPTNPKNSQVLYDGALYPTAEHLFQALKVCDQFERLGPCVLIVLPQVYRRPPRHCRIHPDVVSTSKPGLFARQGLSSLCARGLAYRPDRQGGNPQLSRLVCIDPASTDE